MKKVVFSGTINGESFDNVQDYNKKMEELLGSGETINAHSETSVKEEVEVKKDKAVCPKKSLGDIIPFFGDYDGHYLDTLVTGDTETDTLRLKCVEKDLYEAKKELEEALNLETFDLNEALDALNKYKTIRDSIVEDKYCNEMAKNELKTEISKNYDHLNHLESAEGFIDKLLEGYTTLFNILRNSILGVSASK